jgi:hypothetical protein
MSRYIDIYYRFIMGRYIYIYITNLVCYTYFQWLFNPECQHIFENRRGIYVD